MVTVEAPTETTTMDMVRISTFCRTPGTSFRIPVNCTPVATSLFFISFFYI